MWPGASRHVHTIRLIALGVLLVMPFRERLVLPSAPFLGHSAIHPCKCAGAGGEDEVESEMWGSQYSNFHITLFVPASPAPARTQSPHWQKIGR